MFCLVGAPSILLSAEASIRKSLPHYPFQSIQDEHLTAVAAPAGVQVVVEDAGSHGALQQHHRRGAMSGWEVLTERCAEAHGSAMLESPDWVLIAASARTRALARV